MPDTAPAVLSVQELWFLQMALPAPINCEDWTAALDLHHQVNDGLIFCHDNREVEATLLLTDDSCDIVNSFIRPTMYDAAGQPVGKNILLKTFRASRAIRTGEFPAASASGPNLTSEQTQRLLAFMDEEEFGPIPAPED